MMSGSELDAREFCQLQLVVAWRRRERQDRQIAGGVGLSLSLQVTQDALRTASGPLTSAEIAAAVVQAKGMPPSDAAFEKIVAGCAAPS
jgi:hypothetical protein